MENKKSKLVEWIKNNGLNVEHFACLLRVDRSYVYKLAKGNNLPSQKIMDKIKKITKGDISEFSDLVG